MRLQRWGIYLVALLAIAGSLLTGCSLPQVSAEQRTFLQISLEFLDEAIIPKTPFAGTPVGGLSGITYDRQRDRFYVVSDDRSQLAPARFYTLKVQLDPTLGIGDAIASVDLESVTFLQTEEGNPYPRGTIDAEGIALSPQNTVFISSEGGVNLDIPPGIKEFELNSGQFVQRLPVPPHYLPLTEEGQQIQGIQNNFGFEALATNPIGTIPAAGEPLRLFTVTETALVQDLTNPEDPDFATRTRWLHYYLSEGPPLILSEHLYLLESPPPGAVLHGIPEIVALDGGGHFLSLERSFGLKGFTVRLFQLFTGDATDISGTSSLQGSLMGLQPIRKQLVLDLQDLDITLDNLEGMTLGPRLPDGSQSLWLISDDNFRDDQKTQLLLFRLRRE
ncbi:MAG: esterase-like activity of phytase family protein [Desertifilum sp.]|nr:esterase-like activity of phytase family protein [Desertifilum sp.]